MSEWHVEANMKILGTVLEAECVLSLPRQMEKGSHLSLSVPNAH